MKDTFHYGAYLSSLRIYYEIYKTTECIRSIQKVFTAYIFMLNTSNVVLCHGCTRSF